MFRWFLYDESMASTRDDSEERNPITARREAQETKETETRGGRGAAVGSGTPSAAASNVSPVYDNLDPTVTAAILTQAAFRGYRLRERLRRLPAREAEKAIRGLHRNSRGFQRVALFLLFFGLYFHIVFTAVDLSFQRSVEQGLRDHLSKVKYGPEADRTHADVSSLSDLHLWMQAFFLETYHGTQLEDRCMVCAVRPPDEVCDQCDFAMYDAANEFPSSLSSNVNVNSTRRLSTDTSSPGSSSSSSSSTTFGLSDDCQKCLLGRFCEGEDLAFCTDYAESLSDENSTFSANSWTAPVNSSVVFNASVFDVIDIEPKGGISAAGGFVEINDASDCGTWPGITENLGRFQIDLPVPYNGGGFVADRNRIIGGMLVTFTVRKRFSEGACVSSRDYYDICLADAQQEDPIIPGGAWSLFRPTESIEFNDEAGGYAVLVDTGGFNTGINAGYCTLLLLDDLDIIPPDEVRSVSVQLVTYNGNVNTAYASVFIDFDFEDGGKVLSTELISVYVLQGNVGRAVSSGQWAASMAFLVIFLGMARYDTRQWYRVKRAKARHNHWNCCCGFCFHSLIFLNIIMWLAWAVLGATIEFQTDFQDVGGDGGDVLESITEEVLTLYNVGLFAAAYYFIFLLTTLAGLYRWIFQMLTFHKRMSIVTDTLSRASTHLDHFLFVIFLVVAVFANLTWLLVGKNSSEFATLEEAWRSVVRVTLGEAENFYPQILEAQPTVGPVVIVFYQVLGVVLLLNVVIAVLLEAYRGVVAGMRGEDTILQSLTAFVGMTICSWRVRARWAVSYCQWRLSKRQSSPHGRRPSLKVALQGPTGVYGVDGRPVLMIRRPEDSGPVRMERQLSFNCPRYITVTEMQALIEATPVPSFVADRLVRKIVHEWVFHSDEKYTGDSLSTMSGSYGNSTGRASGSMDSLPMLRKGAVSSSSFAMR